MPAKEHKKHAPRSLKAAIITISDSRTFGDDLSGLLIKNLLEKNQHQIIEYSLIPDDLQTISEKIRQLREDKDVNLIITNGGTGLSRKDVTLEAIRPFFEKELISFNTLFSKLSYGVIGPAAILSRAAAGVVSPARKAPPREVNNKIIFCLPGSPDACQLALEKLILPEMGHIIKHLNEK